MRPSNRLMQPETIRPSDTTADSVQKIGKRTTKPEDCETRWLQGIDLPDNQGKIQQPPV